MKPKELNKYLQATCESCMPKEKYKEKTRLNVNERNCGEQRVLQSRKSHEVEATKREPGLSRTGIRTVQSIKEKSEDKN